MKEEVFVTKSKKDDAPKSCPVGSIMENWDFYCCDCKCKFLGKEIFLVKDKYYCQKCLNG